QLVQGGVGGLQLVFDGWIDAPAVVVEHAHVKAPGAPGDGLSDPPHTDDAKALAVDVAAQKQEGAPTLKLAGPGKPVGFDDPAGDGHEEGPGKVSRGLGQDAGRVGDDDTPGGGGFDVDIVVAHRIVADHLQVGGRVHH